MEQKAFAPTEVQQLLEAGMKIGAVNKENVVDLGDGKKVIVVPNGSGFQVVDLPVPSTAKPAPTRKVGVFHLLDVDSFVLYVNAHKTKGSVVFLDVTPSGATFKAILNHHEDGTEGKAGHQDHIVTYTCEKSVEWARWMKYDQQTITQLQFLEHIEDCQLLIREPNSADLMKLLQGLTGTVGVRFGSALNLFNGKMKLAYEEDVKIRGNDEPGVREADMEIPQTISVVIPPFANGPAYEAKVRLRVRVGQNKLTFSYETVDTHLIVQEVVKEMRGKVAQATQIPILLGR